MDSQQLTKQFDSFQKYSLIFQPNFSNIDPKIHYRYCGIQGISDSENYFREVSETTKELLISQKWRPINQYGSPNVHYEHNKSILEHYLKNYTNGDYKLLESTFVDILNTDGPFGYTILPALKMFFESESQKSSELEVLKRFSQIVKFALKAETILPERIYRIVDDIRSATLSEEQCACLVASMFFNTRRNQSFVEILKAQRAISVEKLKFLMTYFDAVSEESSNRIISFSKIKEVEFLENTLEKARKEKLTTVVISDDLLIEQTALCSQVDFANKHIGGGVLRFGAVQEEIRFLMCPEMFVSMLLFDRMESDEAVSIVGAKVFSSYSGYGNSLKWSSLNSEDSLQNNNDFLDEFRRLRTETIAINAIKFFGKPEKAIGIQLEDENLKKEILKAGVGFSSQSTEFNEIPIVSGWWGCGVYNGNKPLKFLIQVLAAAISRRPLYFCTFKDSSMGNKCRQMIRRLEVENISVGELYDILMKIPSSNYYKETHVFDSIDNFLVSRASSSTSS